VGDPAAEFTLPDDTGHPHTLSQYRGKTVVLYFYPKDDTPGCTAEACGFRDRLGDFAERNAVVLGVSPDSPHSHERFAQKYGLTFPLLADEGHKVAARYGVWVQKSRYGRTYMGVARSTFVIDANGRIAHVFHNVHPDGHEREVLTKL
jgi:peroxiredoxin Q/BCP